MDVTAESTRRALQAGNGTDNVDSAAADAAADALDTPLTVQSVPATTSTSDWSASNPDSFFEKLLTVKFGTGGVTMSVEIVGWFRAAPDTVYLLTASSIVPALKLEGSVLSIAASEDTLAVMQDTFTQTTGDTGARELEDNNPSSRARRLAATIYVYSDLT